MPRPYADHLTLNKKSNGLFALAIGVGVGVVLGLVVVDGALKLLFACLGVIFLALGIVYPRLIMYLVVALVCCLSETQFGLQTQGIFRLSSYTLDPVRLSLYEILIYCLLGILVARRALGKSPRVVPGWITIPCVLLAVILLLQLARALVAGAPYVDAVNPWNGRYILAAVVALWCFAELLSEPLERLRLLDLLYICATGRSVYALFRFVFAGGDSANAYRLSGVKVTLWESADHLLFVFLITVAIAAWATGLVGGRRLVCWASGSFVMALTVVLSYRRTSGLGLAAALILASVIMLGRSQRSIALVAVALAVLGGIGAASYSRFQSGAGLLARLFPDVVSRIGPTRQDEWALAWQTIARDPIAGALTARRAAGQIAPWDTRIVHNAFLFAWMKLGLAGLLSLCVLGATCVVYAIQGVRERAAEEYVSLGVLGIVPFTLLLAMFETPLIEKRTMLILAMAGAFAVGVACTGGQQREPSGHESPDSAGAKDE